jgi:hypothetical protein
MWYAITNIQFILDPYATTTFCISYMTKVNKSIKTKLKSILPKCIVEKTNVNLRILRWAMLF